MFFTPLIPDMYFLIKCLILVEYSQMLYYVRGKC